MKKIKTFLIIFIFSIIFYGNAIAGTGAATEYKINIYKIKKRDGSVQELQNPTDMPDPIKIENRPVVMRSSLTPITPPSKVSPYPKSMRRCFIPASR